jgi:uncharacterized membrane protein
LATLLPKFVFFLAIFFVLHFVICCHVSTHKNSDPPPFFVAQLDSRFAPVYKEVATFKQETSRSHEALSSEITNIHSKVDDLTRTTQSLFFGLEKQSKGIGLLCDFVCQSQNTNAGTAPTLMEDLQEYAKSTSAQPLTRTQVI